MDINIKSENAVSLEFSTSIILNDNQISQIQSESHPDKDGNSFFLDIYEGHTAYCWVVKSDKRNKQVKNKYSLNFFYKLSTRTRQIKKSVSISRLMDVLSSITDKNNFDCEISFKFPKRLKPKPIINLPLKYTESPNMPFDMIQGFHLIKLEGRKTKYSVILGASDTGIIYATIFFDFNYGFDVSLAKKIFEYGLSIVSNFVSKG